MSFDVGRDFFHFISVDGFSTEKCHKNLELGKGYVLPTNFLFLVYLNVIGQTFMAIFSFIGART